MGQVKFDQVTSVAKCLWKQRPELKRNEVNQDDVTLLVRLTGKLIGHSLDGKREFYVQDGIVYMVWPGVDVSCLDYFEFCKLLRCDPPLGRVLDFQPASGFHLGWPRPQGECSAQPMTTILPPRPMTMGDEPQAMRPPRLDDMARSRGVESAPVDNRMGPSLAEFGYGERQTFAPPPPMAQPMGPPPIQPMGAPAPNLVPKKEGGGPAEFELMYDPQGHGGPHVGLGNATMNAFLHLKGGTDSCVHIVPRSNRVLSKTDAIRRVFKEGDGLICYQDDPDHKPEQVTPAVFS